MLRNHCQIALRLNLLHKVRLFSSDKPTKPLEQLSSTDVPIIDFDDPVHLPIPEYPIKLNEPLQKQKRRLLYQSRKRGILENDLLLSTFASKYLHNMSEEQTRLYDNLINGVTNDWDIYYWATNAKPTPPEYDNELMAQLKQHVLNENKEKRLRQPDL